MPQNADVRAQAQSDETEIDLLELARVVWQKIWMVAIGFIVGAVLVFVVTKFFVTPQYKATSSIYIFSKSTSLSSLADIQIGNNLTADFQYIAVTRDTIEDVIQELHLDTTYEELSKNVTVTNPTSTHVLEISAINPNPVIAANISNTLADHVRTQISDIMNTDKPSVVQRAVVPEKKTSPNVTRNTMIGALLGAVLVAAVVIVKYLMDDTIKSDEDVRKYLQLDTLAQIPYIKGWDEKKAASRNTAPSKKASAKSPFRIGKREAK